MKKIKGITTISIVVALGIVSSIVAFANNQKDIWKEIENSYYCGDATLIENGVKNEMKYDLVDGNIANNNKLNYDKLNTDILGDGEVYPSFTTVFYESKMDFYSEESIENFKRSVKEEGFSAALNFNNEYWAIAKREHDLNPSTAIIKKNKIVQLYLGDNGDKYKINLDSNLKDSLSSSNLNLDETKAYYFWLEGFARGIAFDDGENQLIQISGSRYNMIENGVYTIDELMSIIDKNIDELTYSYNDIDGMNNDEKQVFYTGGALS